MPEDANFCGVCGKSLRFSKILISNFIAKYAKRSNFEEEAEWVGRLLDEDVETLKQCLQLAKSMGYTNYELMPIIAAYGLKKYHFKKGVDEDVCREVGISKKALEDYIVKIGTRTTNWRARAQILAEMEKGQFG
jgi:hypothetical protein